jgi:cytochrome b involved in lipid metabolism
LKVYANGNQVFAKKQCKASKEQSEKEKQRSNPKFRNLLKIWQYTLQSVNRFLNAVTRMRIPPARVAKVKKKNPPQTTINYRS